MKFHDERTGNYDLLEIFQRKSKFVDMKMPDKFSSQIGELFFI